MKTFFDRAGRTHQCFAPALTACISMARRKSYRDTAASSSLILPELSPVRTVVQTVHSSIQYLAALRTLLSLAQWRWQLARRPALYLCRLSTICLRFRASFSSLAQGRQKLALRTFVSLAQWRRKLGRRTQLYILMLCIGFFYGRMTRRAAWTPYR